MSIKNVEEVRKAFLPHFVLFSFFCCCCHCHWCCCCCCCYWAGGLESVVAATLWLLQSSNCMHDEGKKFVCANARPSTKRRQSVWGAQTTLFRRYERIVRRFGVDNVDAIDQEPRVRKIPTAYSICENICSAKSMPKLNLFCRFRSITIYPRSLRRLEIAKPNDHRKGKEHEGNEVPKM